MKLLSIFLLCLAAGSAFAQSSFGPIFTYGENAQLAKPTDLGIGANGTKVFFCAPNVGGTGSSAGKLTLLSAPSGSIDWQLQAGYEMLDSSVDAASGNAALAAVTAERDVASGPVKVRMRAWASAFRGTSTPTYTIPMEFGTKIGCHISNNGYAVGWVWSATNGLAIYTVSTATGVFGGTKLSQYTDSPLYSTLSKDGEILSFTFNSPSFREVIVHVGEDPVNCPQLSELYPVLYDSTSAFFGPQGAGGLASVQKDVSARVGYDTGAASTVIEVSHGARFDWNTSTPQQPTEWGIWKQSALYPTSVGSLFPVDVRVSPNGNTVAAPLYGLSTGQAGFVFYDTSAQDIPLSFGPLVPANQVLLNGTPGSSFGYRQVEFINETLAIGVSTDAGAHPALVSLSKQGGVWGSVYLTGWPSANPSENKLFVSPANRAAVISYRTVASGSFWFITLYEIAP